MARPRPTSPRCPRCNAPFTLVAEQVLYTCHYCNASIDTRGEQAPRPLYQAPSTGANKGPLFLGMGLAILVLGVVTSLLVMGPARAPSAPPPPRPAPIATPPTAQIPPAPAAKPKFAWDMDNAPTVADVNGDGTDDIIGTIRRGASYDRYSTAAFDGKTLEPLWETPIEGAAPTDLASRERHIRQGNRLVRRDAMAVSLLELATGKVVGRVALSDKPDKLCIPQGDTSAVWVSVTDKQNILLDTTTATARPAAQTPPNCQRPERSRYDCSPAIHRKTHLQCSLALKAPPVPGFRGEYIYTAHGLDVVLGARNPGTRVPMAAVFEKGAKVPLWHGAIADMDTEKILETTPEVLDISEDALFMAYRLRAGGMHLVRRDARTGAVTWDVPIPRSKDGSLVTSLRKHGDRLYVPHWMWLDVFDAKTGNVVGTIGTW